jgi:hypothetical protein
MSKNAEKLRRSPIVGDYFTVATGNTTIIGRVIRKNETLASGPMPECLLVYIYRYSNIADISQRAISSKDLLTAPFWTNAMGWKRKCFVTIANEKIVDNDYIQDVTFFDMARKKYRNHFGNFIDKGDGFCGLWALVSYLYIIDKVKDSLEHAENEIE